MYQIIALVAADAFLLDTSRPLVIARYVIQLVCTVLPPMLAAVTLHLTRRMQRRFLAPGAQHTLNTRIAIRRNAQISQVLLYTSVLTVSDRDVALMDE